jgi:hypothetical protein
MAEAAHALQYELNAVVADLQASAWVGSPPTAEAADAHGARVPAVAELDAFELLLQAADFNALASYRALQAGLRGGPAGAAADLDAALRAFDFERALQALRAWRAVPA